MVDFDARKYGIEPNVTGIEEEINLAYLDGAREAKFEIAKNLTELGSDEEFIVNTTGLDLDDVRKLKHKSDS